MQVTKSMINNYVEYLRKFGTERYKRYLINLGVLCFSELYLDFNPFEHTFDEICQFLTNKNLWHTIYLL